MACQPPRAHHATAGQRFVSGGEGTGPPRRRNVFRRIKYGAHATCVFGDGSHSDLQDENFEEYEGVYDELNLNEEEEKFGLAQEEAESSGSEDTSEGRVYAGSRVRLKFTLIFTVDLPPRTPLHRKSEEDSITSKRDGSPVLKKAPVTTQRSKFTLFFDLDEA